MTNITIPRNVAEQLYELYKNVSVADAHYKRCQSDNFRMHIKSVYQNQAVASAYDELQKAFDEAAEPVAVSEETPKPASSRRRSVLADD